MEQEIALHQPLATSGGRTRITHVYDQGANRGVVLVTDRELLDAGSPAPIAHIPGREYCRGEGDFGGEPAHREVEPPWPASEPDHEESLTVAHNAALIYRLSGDDNPLRADPLVARTAGFERPILHRLCTFGMAAYGLVCTLCEGKAHELRQMRLRFIAPVYPGGRLTIQVWRTSPGTARFRVTVPERDTLVIDGGHCRFAREEVAQ